VKIHALMCTRSCRQASAASVPPAPAAMPEPPPKSCTAARQEPGQGINPSPALQDGDLGGSQETSPQPSWGSPATGTSSHPAFAERQRSSAHPGAPAAPRDRQRGRIRPNPPTPGRDEPGGIASLGTQSPLLPPKRGCFQEKNAHILMPEREVSLPGV